MEGLHVVVPAFLAALGSGLVAGVFFAFSAFVMGALGRLPPGQGIAAMQSINRVVLNPWFLGVFFGTAALSLVLVVLGLGVLGEAGGVLLAGGGLLYLAGCILVTILFNVPLNNGLAKVAADDPEAAGLWARYRSVWTGWNHVRTVASLLAAAAFTLALC